MMDKRVMSTPRRLLLGLACGGLVVSALVGCTAPAGDPTSSPSASATAGDPPAGLESVVQQDIDNAWGMVVSQYPDAVRPEVERVRFVQLDEVAPIIADCLVSAGWTDVTATPDSGIDSGTVPTAQAEAYAIAFYVCHAKYPLDPKYSVPLDDDQIKLIYAYYRDGLAPCLEAQGFQVPDAPSEQQFLDTYAETGGWDVYGNVAPQVDQEGWYEINAECPQLPEDLYG